MHTLARTHFHLTARPSERLMFQTALSFLPSKAMKNKLDKTRACQGTQAAPATLYSVNHPSAKQKKPAAIPKYGSRL